MAPGGLHFDKSFYKVSTSNASAFTLSIILNSTINQLMVNLEGRANFGGGLLEIEVYETNNLKIVNPSLVNSHLDMSIFTSSDWDVSNPSPERRQVDEVVFDALGLTQGEQDAVYEGVAELVGNRLRRARSV